MEAIKSTINWVDEFILWYETTNDYDECQPHSFGTTLCDLIELAEGDLLGRIEKGFPEMCKLMADLYNSPDEVQFIKTLKEKNNGGN